MKNNIFRTIIIFNLFLSIFSCKKAEKDLLPGDYQGTVSQGKSDDYYYSLPRSLSSAKIQIVDISSGTTAADKGLNGFKYELIIINNSTSKKFLYNIGINKSGSTFIGSYQSNVKSDYTYADLGFKADGTVTDGSLTLKLLSENTSNGGALEEFYTASAKK